MGMLYTCADHREILREFRRILHPGGLLIADFKSRFWVLTTLLRRGKLPAAEREPLLEICDRALRRTVEHLQPGLVVGVGVFAEARARAALDDSDVAVGRILHPSPASPAANRGWSERATFELRELGFDLP